MGAPICLQSGEWFSSVDAWFSTALDIEEVMFGAGGDQLHVMVADVIKSFDKVDKSILDCASGRVGLPPGSGKSTSPAIVRFG